MKRKQIDDLYEKCDQLYEAFNSVAKHRDSYAIEKVLTIIDEGGKELLMNYMYPFANDISSDIHPLNQAMNMRAPLEIIYKMIDIGGKEFLLKDYRNPNNSWNHCYTPLHNNAFLFMYDDEDEEFEELQESALNVLRKLLEVGGRDLVMKRCKRFGRTALHNAVYDGRYDEVTKELIKFGGKELVMTKDIINGNTALHNARAGPVSLQIIELLIDVGGKDLLEVKNNYGVLAVQNVALCSSRDFDLDEVFKTLVILVKEGIYHNVGGEFSIGGLLVDEKIEDFFAHWRLRLWLVVLEVYCLIQHKSCNQTLPILHSMIMIKAPKDIIYKILCRFVGVASIKDSLGRYAIDVAIEMNLPFDKGLEDILEVTASENGWSTLYCAAYHGLPWNNGMEEIVLENFDYALNGVNKETGLKLFMTAAIGGNLDAIYSLVRMDPVCIFIDTKNDIQSNNIARLSIGNRENTNIRVTNVNQGALKKVLKFGREKKKDEKLVQRRQARQQRMLATRKAMYEELYSKYDDDKEFEMYEYINKF